MSSHVDVPEHLRVPVEYEDVIGFLRLVDPALRLRRSAEARNLFILERRCTRSPAVNTSMRDLSDMHIQKRDGYIHVASVHPSFLPKPWNIVRALKTEGADLWAEGGAQQWASEQEYEEAWMKETRRRRRLGLYRDIAVDGFDALNRHNIGGERSRINSAGVRPHADFLPGAAGGSLGT